MDRYSCVRIVVEVRLVMICASGITTLVGGALAMSAFGVRSGWEGLGGWMGVGGALRFDGGLG
jgi:hypothetical protein